MQTIGSILFLAFLIKTIGVQPQEHPRQINQPGRIQPLAFGRKMKEYCYDRLLLLVCANYCNISLPNESRRDILRLLTNYSSQRSIPFSVHARVNAPIPWKLRNQHPIFENDCAKIESRADAFIAYVVAQRPFAYEFTNSNKSWKNNVKNLTNWLKAFQLASNLIKAVNATDLDEILDEQSQKIENQKDAMLALLLFSDRCPYRESKQNKDGRSATERWWSKFAESLVDRADQLLFLQMDIDGDREDNGFNEVFVQQRLPEIDMDTICPRLILIKQGSFLDYHIHAKNADSFPNLYENQTIPQIRKFVLDALENRLPATTEWIKLGGRQTDIEYIYYAQENIAQAKMINKKFMAVGTTGGIGVIALAISIFWGLKSSSYTGVTQTAILALAETNPSLFLATKKMKRHSSM